MRRNLLLTPVCAIVGHDTVDHTKYKIKADTGRARYGDLCKRCEAFVPATSMEENAEARDAFED